MARILLRKSCRENGTRVVTGPRGSGSEFIPDGTFRYIAYYYNTETKLVETGAEDNLTSCSNFYRSTSEILDEYCDGDDSIKVYYDGRYGVELVREEGGCGSAGCDLFFESFSTSDQDGEYGFLFFSLNKPAEVSFNDFATSFEYNTPLDGIQLLPPGDYTLKARTSSSCVIERGFTIKEQVNYNVKWFFEYKDKLDSLTRVEIYEKSYTGEPQEIEYISSSPLTINWKGRGNDKYRPIVTSECVLNVISKDDFEYISLFSSDEKAHRVDINKDGDLFWSGYIVPDVYNEPYKAPPYNMAVSATDGLNSLKNYEYNVVSKYSTYLEVINYCLNNISNLNIVESTFINPEEIQEGSPLQNLSVKNDAINGLNCYEVLERILFANISRLTQYNGKWQIKPIDSILSEHVEREFSEGELISSNLIDPVVSIGDIRNGIPYFLKNRQHLNIKPAYKELTIIQDFGTQDQILKNNEFDFKGEELEGWEGDIFFKRTYREENGDLKDAVGFLRPISQIIPVDPNNDGSRLEVEVDYRVTKKQEIVEPSIEISFGEGDSSMETKSDYTVSQELRIWIEIKLSGSYYIYSNLGFTTDNSDRPSTNRRYYKTDHENAQEFLNWASAISDEYTYTLWRKSTDSFGRETINQSAEGNIVRIEAKELDIDLDFGDVTTEGIATITARDNEVLDFSKYSFQMVIYAIDIDGIKKSLTSTAHWVSGYSIPTSTGLQPNIIDMPLEENWKWQNFRITTDPLPDFIKEIKVELRGWALNSLTARNNPSESEVKRISVNYLPSGDFAPQTDTLKIKNSTEALTFTPPDYKLYFGDTPMTNPPNRISNARNIFNNVLYYQFGEDYHMTSYFNAAEKLSNLIGKLIMKANYTQVQVITGILYGNVDFNSSFYDPNNPGRLFIINSMKYNDRHKEYDLELVEMTNEQRIYNARLLESGGFRLLEDEEIRMLE